MNIGLSFFFNLKNKTHRLAPYGEKSVGFYRPIGSKTQYQSEYCPYITSYRLYSTIRLPLDLSSLITKL